MDPFHFIQPANPKVEEERVRAAFVKTLSDGGLEKLLEETRTQALLVIQDDTLLFEWYPTGSGRATMVTSFSAAKSFVSTLVGIAIAEGHIGGVDDPIADYLPELAVRNPRFAEISIRNLLDMSSGIKYVETSFVNGDDALTYYYPDLRSLALEQTRIAGPPGETWLYNNYHPLLLGLILERATGMHVAEYLEKKVWQPVGAEYPASWSLDSQETGFEKMESGINARAIDFAKLGRLYLNQGELDGERILPAEWVVSATRMDKSIDRSSFYPNWMEAPFGHVYHQRLWWGVQTGQGAYAYAAQGKYGQTIFVMPEKRLIVVRNGEREGSFPGGWLGFLVGFAQNLAEK